MEIAPPMPALALARAKHSGKAIFEARRLAPA
jgi:hypothetical protein